MPRRFRNIARPGHADADADADPNPNPNADVDAEAEADADADADAATGPQSLSCESFGAAALSAVTRHLPHLTTLALANHTRLTDASLMQLTSGPRGAASPSITSLDISACPRVSAPCVVHLAWSLPVRELHIARCWRLESVCLEELLQRGAVLERLQVVAVAALASSRIRTTP